MRRSIVLLSLVASLSAPCVGFAANAAPSPSVPAKPALDDPDRIVCTREKVVGSNRPKKVCMTVAQREEIREMARFNMDERQRNAGTASSLTGSGASGPY